MGRMMGTIGRMLGATGLLLGSGSTVCCLKQCRLCPGLSLASLWIPKTAIPNPAVDYYFKEGSSCYQVAAADPFITCDSSKTLASGITTVSGCSDAACGSVNPCTFSPDSPIVCAAAESPVANPGGVASGFEVWNYKTPTSIALGVSGFPSAPSTSYNQICGSGNCCFDPGGPGACFLSGTLASLNGTYSLTQDASYRCAWLQTINPGPLTIRYNTNGSTACNGQPTTTSNELTAIIGFFPSDNIIFRPTLCLGFVIGTMPPLSSIYAGFFTYSGATGGAGGGNYITTFGSQTIGQFASGTLTPPDCIVDVDFVHGIPAGSCLESGAPGPINFLFQWNG